MLLRELIQKCRHPEAVITEAATSASDAHLALEVRALTEDSREAGPDTIFAATPVGLPYLDAALQAGVRVVLLPIDDDSLPRDRVASIFSLRARDIHSVAGDLSSALQDHPSDDLELIAVTGTNGKTSIALMTYGLWERFQIPAGCIGTLGVRYRGRDGREIRLKTGFTTPRANRLQEILAQMRDAGVRRVVLEASSEGLAMGRLKGCRIATALFTNLSRDHLDYHGTMESYFQCKAKLFFQTASQGGRCVLYTGDAYGARLAQMLAEKYGDAIPLERIGEPLAAIAKNMPAFYRINATLSLHAAFAGETIGEDALQALKDLPPAPGRFQIVRPADTNDSDVSPIFGIVDYAHTPDALRNLLQAVRAMPVATVACIFGCGGDRDTGKRFAMGRIAAEYSDLVIVTDDNPRSEDPEAIRREIMCGVKDYWAERMESGGHAPEIMEIGNRRKALEAAAMWASGRSRKPIALAAAGKGHEEIQIIKDRREPFSDIVALQEILDAL